MTAEEVRALARTVLDTMLAGDLRPIAVAHPLDFVCIPLLRTTGFGVCGHVWHTGEASTMVHSHSWDLDSQVVAGAVTNEIFTVTDDPCGAHELLVINSSGAVDLVTPTGHNVDLTIAQREQHPAGDSYHLPAGSFHRSTPSPAGPTLTLLSATTVPGARDQVAGAAHSGSGVPIQRRQLPAPAALDLAALLRGAL